MKLMKMSYSNKKKKQITLAMLNKQKNNAFLQRVKKNNQTTVQLGTDSIRHTHTQHMYRYKQNQTG